jgi:hypothetical protein
MWISRDPGRRPAIFHMLIRDNARRRWQNGECLIHGNPLLCGLRALQQRDPRGKVPPAVPDFHIRGERPVDFLPSARHPVSGMLRDVEAAHGLRHVALPGGVDKVISSGPHDRLPRIQGT